MDYRKRIKSALEILHDALAEDESSKALSEAEFKGCVQSLVGCAVEAVDDEIEEALTVLRARAT